jgi:hypothetical protein
MFYSAEGDVPATVTKQPFGYRAADTGRAKIQTVKQGDAEMETVAAQGKLDRAKHPAAYMREPDEVAPQAGLVGKRVRLAGLVKRDDYNGLTGTVAAFNHGTDRYAVEVDHVGRMALKAANLIEI